MKRLLLPLLISIAAACEAQSSFNVHFDTDKFNLTADATTSIDSFLLHHSTNTKLRLYGHCDIMADYDYNDKLSEKRTHAVKNYLVSKGFNAADIIEEKGFGKRRPINNNHGEREMYLNRRVEIVVEGETVTTSEENNQNEKISIAAKTLTEVVADTQTRAGTNIVLHNMNFYGGTHTILPESLPVLMELVEIMKKNPNLEIAVEGHICCQDGPGDGYDIGTRTMNLSENRAREICLYLSKNGIASHRLKYKGFGHQSPLTPYPEKTEEERVNNRRVEIKILKK